MPWAYLSALDCELRLRRTYVRTQAGGGVLKNRMKLNGSFPLIMRGGGVGKLGPAFVARGIGRGLQTLKTKGRATNRVQAFTG